MQAKISSRTPVVRPHVISEQTGETVLLEDLVEDLIDRRGKKLQIEGQAGLGKSTALAYLDSLPLANGVILADDADLNGFPSVHFNQLMVYTTRTALDGATYRCRLAPWGIDELIEYLLGNHPDSCSSIISRFQIDDGFNMLNGIPQLICMIADQMANDSQLSVESAFANGLRAHLPSDTLLRKARLFSIASIRKDSEGANAQKKYLENHPALRRLVETRPVQIKLAADHLFATLKDKPKTLEEHIPFDLVQATAKLVRENPIAIQHLRERIATGATNQGMVASLLHLSDDDWKPDAKIVSLSDGYFANAQWQALNLAKVLMYNVDLTLANLNNTCFDGATLSQARFCDSNLEDANLSLAKCQRADFSDANLLRANFAYGEFAGCDFSYADLTNVTAIQANFTAADFSSAQLGGGRFKAADFRGARLVETNFFNANLRRANLCHLDFRSATLDKADFRHAKLIGANLEEMRITAAKFPHANLTRALLSDSIWPGVNMRRARLCGAGLADIHWEGADLREVDFRNSTFHYGSTRCGLVDSPYPSHGTRTGFYTDDYNEQSFKAPEDIRKANLVNADLRDANVSQTDFYLVDLRGAKYDASQRKHFERCHAILD